MSDDLKMLYQQTILEHGRNPRNQGRVSAVTHRARGHNPLCGDVIDLTLHQGQGDIVEDIAFEGRGCAIALATASLMTEMVKGRDAQTVRTLGQTFDHVANSGEAAIPHDLADEDAEKMRMLAGIAAFPMRIKCATLPWRTLEAALARQSSATTEINQSKLEA